jgi:hypothetical protein
LAKCNWNFGTCEAVATTTLTKNSGEIVQLCEEHRDWMIKLFGRIASGEYVLDWRDDGEIQANHWFVLNKIPS